MKILIVCFLVCCGLVLSKTFPKVPEDFTAVVEYTDPHRNATVTVAEYWDSANNRAKTEYFSHEEAHGVVVLANEGVEYFIDYFHRTCHRRNITVGRNRITQNGHVSAVRTLFTGSNLNYTYNGEHKVRNMWADKFTAEEHHVHSFGNISHTTEYFFAVPDWKIFGFKKHVIPIRIHIKGSFTPKTGAPREFTNYINIMNFEPGSDSHRTGFNTYHVPHYCPRTSATHSLPKISDQYRTNIEITFKNQRSTFSMVEYFNRPAGEVRLDSRAFGHDFAYHLDTRRNLSYVVDLSDNYCRQFPYHENTRFTSNVHVLSPSQLFQFGDEYNFKYYGNEHVEGIYADKWVAQFPGGGRLNHGLNYTLTWYFVDETWTTFAYHREHRIPLRAIFSGYVSGTLDHPNNFEMIVDFHQFVVGPEVVPRSVFRVPKGCWVERNPIPLPEIADSFSMVTQISEPLKKFTFSFREHVDEVNDRVRFEHYSGQQYNVTIVDVKNKKVQLFTASWANKEDTSCREVALDTSNHHVFTNNGTLKSIKDLWHFGTKYGVKYTGRDWVRGIHADHWFSHWNSTSMLGFKNHYWTHEFFFTVAHWKNPGSNSHRAPIRSILKAYPYHHRRPSHKADFIRTFDYSDYVPQVPSARLFRPLPKCPGYVPTESKYSNEFGRATAFANYTFDSAYFLVSMTTLVFGVLFGFGSGALLIFFTTRVAVSKTPSGKGFGRVDDVATDL
eukprot:gene1353-11435_t